MRRNLKKVLALALAAVLCLGVLAGCGSSFSADGLVKGNLDLIYLNQYTDSYLKSVGLTKEDANQQYEDGIAVEVSYFADYFNIELDSCDESIETEIAELYRQIYSHSKYEVGGVSRNGETYLVELTIYPMDVMQKVMSEDVEAFGEDWQARGAAGEFDEMTDEEFETVWAQSIIDLVTARVTTIGYLEPETISVQVAKNDAGLYTISDNDFNRIDSLIIDYSYSG